MQYKRFEDLPVWKDAIDFSVNVFEFTSQSRGLFGDLGDLKNQIERASVSISRNIAEGFERGSDTELIRFLYIARGSCGECRSLTHIFGSVPNFRSKKHQVQTLRSSAEAISRQLVCWIESLQNTSRSEGTKIRNDIEAIDANGFRHMPRSGEQVDFDKME
ncbi:MAG: four helix bundle protein [Acidobacteriota bacterium]|nr:MAG: four helix bundle protein [Acidobacteriota bacterium]